MSRLILCEGKTDAILLSYYLEKVCGWTYTRAPKDLSIRESGTNESVNWYEKDGEKLLICGVGGKDNFGNFYTRAIRAPLITANAFEKIAVVLDRDDREIEDIEQSIETALGPVIPRMKNQKWTSCQYTDSFKMEQNLALLLIVIPLEQQGALETVLLEAISEDAYDRNIVERCRRFVDEIRPEADRYISSDRLQLKADLSVTWAVQSPQKVFDFIDKQIRSVHWESSRTLRECFCELEKI